MVDEQKLWLLWQSHKSAKTRIKLFFSYSVWARMLASQVQARYPHPLAEWSDYVNLSAMGLLQAIDRFDATLPTRFQSYAEPFVRGAILKGLSCYVRDRQRVTRDRLDCLSGEGRLEEGDFESAVNAAIELAFGYFLDLGIVDAAPLDNNPLSIYEQEHRDQGLDLMLERLPERERQVLVGHYYQHLSFVELSQLLGISKSRVSQLHGQALKRARRFYVELGYADSYF